MKRFKYERKTFSDLIDKGLTCKEILETLKMSKRTLYNYLNSYGLFIPNYHNSLKFDNTVFDSIETEEKSYWLGFLYADGYVSNGDNNNTVELSLKGDDFEHLNKFNTFIKNTKNLKISKSSGNFTRSRCLITDKHFRERLIELGCIPKKSLILTFPSINIFGGDISLVNHFIRGYVDGDGCLSHLNNKRGKRLQLSILGTKEFLSGIIKFFPQFGSIGNTQSSKKGLNSYRIYCCSDKADEVAKILYKNATIYLERKYNKFAELCRNI